MALIDRVTARLSDQRQRNLSNPNNPGAATNDLVRLQAAADDAQAMLETVIGVVYDDTNAQHVAYAVSGVDLILRIRQSGRSLFNDDSFKEWKSSLRELAGTQGRATFAPKATTGYTPSSPETGRPPFDMRNFDDYRMKAPRQNNRLPGDSS